MAIIPSRLPVFISRTGFGAMIWSGRVHQRERPAEGAMGGNALRPGEKLARSRQLAAAKDRTMFCQRSAHAITARMAMARVIHQGALNLSWKAGVL